MPQISTEENAKTYDCISLFFMLFVDGDGLGGWRLDRYARVGEHGFPSDYHLQCHVDYFSCPKGKSIEISIWMREDSTDNCQHTICGKIS